MRCFLIIAVVVVGSVPVSGLHAEEGTPADTGVRKAIKKSISLIEKGAAGSAEQRVCFTCHNQALPVMAVVEARKRGFAIDEETLKAQVKHTSDHLKRGRKNYLEGRGQGGRVITAGYALWALEAAGQESDEVTTAVTGFLLEYQKKADHWSHSGNRPPSSGSNFTASYVALRGLAAFGTEEQMPKIEARKESVGKWLLTAKPKDTEDRVFRLRSLKYADVDEKTIDQATDELIGSQREDGGWAQTDDMKSDAYATATAVVALLRAGDLKADHPTVRRGIKYLLDTQKEDGSWHVVTRAKPIQTYFESGFPHGKDQFISIAATSWAAIALLLTLPEES